MPEECGTVAAEEGIFQDVSLTIEAGAVGGQPQPRPLFGSSINVEFILPQANQFDFYHSGGLKLAVLGLAECNSDGSINVTKMGRKIPGAGGFIDIAENARKVLFCGTFTMKGLKVCRNF
jgi:propionate CoA-transferase